MKYCNQKRQKNVNELPEMNEINVIEVFYNDAKVGRLALTPEMICAFEYDVNYLATGLSISPFFLPLKKEVFLAKRQPFNGGFGVFDDSLPDGWGNLILDRYLKTKGIQPEKLNILQRLALVGSNGRGALEYRPDLSEFSDNELKNFDFLAKEIEKVLKTEYSGEGVEVLYKYGGSPGGVRPKIFVKTENKEWMIKFRATNDSENIGKTEYEYSLLARKCGINMFETRLFEGKYFGTERFDRTSSGKIHTLSAAGLLNANYREPSLDYTSLLQLCHILTKNMEEVYALYRIMVFNVAIKNRDDHAKNFSFQLINNEWKLSPGYDLLPGNGFNGYYTTTVNGNGEPTEKDMIIVAEKIGLNKQKCIKIIREINDIVK